MSTYPFGTYPEPHDTCAVLAVNLDKDDAASLAQLLSGSNWILREARTCHEAVVLARGDVPPAVLCAMKMPDADWRSLLSELQKLPDAPAVIVASRFAEERLWAEVLNLGGYDVLFLPLQGSELLRALSLARSAFYRRTKVKTSSPALVTSSALENLARAMASYSEVRAGALK